MRGSLLWSMLRFFEAHRSRKWGVVPIYCVMFSTESARATLLQRGDASRGSSTESARATLLQRVGASRGSSTESATATLLQRGDASRGSPTESRRLGRGDASRATLLQRCRGNGLEEATWEVRPGGAQKEPEEGVQGAGLRLCWAGRGHRRAEAATCGGGQ